MPHHSWKLADREFVTFGRTYSMLFLLIIIKVPKPKPNQRQIKWKEGTSIYHLFLYTDTHTEGEILEEVHWGLHYLFLFI